MQDSEEGFIKRSSEDTRPSTPSPLPPILPLDAHQRYGSVRSILRDRNTPASGQNVRFFSRDAYRVISPDVSGNAGSSVEPEPTTFMQRVQDMGADHSTMSGNDEDDTATYHSAYASPHPTTFNEILRACVCSIEGAIFMFGPMGYQTPLHGL